MKKTLGLWIDHRKTVIVEVSDKENKTRTIESNVDKQPGRIAGIRSTEPYEAQMVPADNSRERKFTGQLNNYYDEIIGFIRDAESIVLLGPGEAKGELKKRLERDKLGGLINAVETVGEMTLELEGSEDQLKKAVEYLEGQGVKVGSADGSTNI